MTPGRVGTSSPELGVPVSFAQISDSVESVRCRTIGQATGSVLEDLSEPGGTG